MASARLASAPGARSSESPTKGWLRALEMSARVEAAKDRVLGDLIAERAMSERDATALISDFETMTYRGLSEQCNRWSRWAFRRGVARGETVALIMRNRPQYLAMWLGVTRVGGVVALINTSLRGPSLSHALAVAEAGHVVMESGLMTDMCAALVSFSGRTWIDPWTETEFQALDAGPLCEVERRGTSQSDLALLIYTSGTTGLPKAARVSHHRLMMWSHWFAGLIDARRDDRLYDCLPMHHSVGGVVAPGAMLVAGGSIVVAERFSARRFWPDVRRHECTVFQYIGELCRYLLEAPASLDARSHRLRLAVGNGLTADVWTRFKERFGIPRILEFYAATEGNFSLYNLEGEPGAIGRVPPFLAHRFPVAIVAFDVDSGAPARDATGRCIRCADGETGEAIAKIGRRPGDTGGRFEGYTNERDTEAKVIRDVFAQGDAWVRSGDLMRKDERGFFRFVDRVGDTYRWKGENVATGEVAAALNACLGIERACVYGVKVPGAEGRAGMAALVVGRDFDIDGLAPSLAASLPPYALPLYLRLVESLAVTETFKLQKAALAREAYDPGVVKDPLYSLDPKSGIYVPLLFANAAVNSHPISARAFEA